MRQLFIVLNCALKLSFWRWWQAALFGVACGAFVVLTLPLATEQSRSGLTALLADRAVVQDATALITLEAAVCAAWCFVAARKVLGGKLSVWGRILQAYPGLLVFPVLFYLLAQCIYALPGVGFGTIGWGLAAGVTAGVPALSVLVRRALPEAGFRVEIHGLVSLVVCLLGLIFELLF